jgi:hypothetical protein
MADKKNILLRLDKDLYASIAKWAADDLRSVNAQIEFLLTDAVRRAGRRPAQRPEDAPPTPEPS